MIDTLFPNWIVDGQLQRGTPTACRDFTSAISLLPPKLYVLHIDLSHGNL